MPSQVCDCPYTYGGGVCIHGAGCGQDCRNCEIYQNWYH